MPVATRRQAQKADLIAEPDPELTLRKKPVRKTATNKKPAPDVETTDNATRPTRGRAAKTNIAAGAQDFTVESRPISNKSATATRAKKGTTSSDQDARKVVAPRATRNGGTTRAKAAEKVVVTTRVGRNLKKESEEKKAQASQTAQPLSPKKVSQVGRASTKASKTTSLKATTTRVELKPGRNGSRPGSRRAVSDENELPPPEAGPPDTHANVTEPTNSHTEERMASDETVDTAISASLLRSTPRSKIVEPSSELTTSVFASRRRKREDNDSEDELAGPKTPMRRCSPRTAARYQASVRNTIRRLGPDWKTPAPQSPEYAHDSPSVQVSASSSMQNSPSMGQDKSAVPSSEDHDLSFCVDEAILGSPIKVPTPLVQMLELPSHLANFTVSDGDECHASTRTAPQTSGPLLQPDDETIQIDDEGDETICLAEPLISVDLSVLDDSVVIDRIPTEKLLEIPENGLDQSTLATEDKIAQDKPETVIWQNVTQDNTIDIDFDRFLSGVRLPIQSQPTDESSWDAESTFTSLKTSPIQPSIDTVPEDVPQSATNRRETVNFNDFVNVDALSQTPECTEAATLTRKEIVPIVASSGSEVVGNGDVKDNVTSEHEQDNELPSDTPHYAQSTFAFDVRRKSLPVLNPYTPLKTGIRPYTSDGTSASREKPEFAWLTTRRGPMSIAAIHGTPCRVKSMTSRISNATLSRVSPIVMTADSSRLTSPIRTPATTRSRFSPYKLHEQHAQTIAGPSRFRSPLRRPSKRRRTTYADMDMEISRTPIKKAVLPATVSPAACSVASSCARRPRLAPQNTYEEHMVNIAEEERARSPSRSHATSVALSPKRTTSTTMTPTRRLTPELESTISHPAAITTPGERYPRSWNVNTSERPKTVTVATRFETPLKTPPRRPATMKRDALRRAAMTTQAIRTSHTPVKTPLKAATATPSQVLMTPHPCAPLKGVLALVEVFTLEGATASAPFAALLVRLGARTTRAWSDRITHVVFKDGSPKTLQRVKLHNKEVEQTGQGAFIHCVNSRWVTDCDYDGSRKDEHDEEYAVDVTDLTGSCKRRRRSMEPSALLNLNGNVVRDRKSSLGRSSLSRSLFKTSTSDVDTPTDSGAASPRVDASPLNAVSTPDVEMPDSPATPAWIAAPDKLVQQTAPMNRVRKLALKGEKGSKNRRLTFWNGETS